MKKTRRRTKEKREQKKKVLLGFLAVASFLTMILAPAGEILGGNSREYQERVADVVREARIARLEISLSGTTLEEINAGEKNTKYAGNTARLIEQGEVREFNEVEIKGRGNSTWGQEKKPYQIKLREKAEILGLGRAKKWVLLANYFDETNLRNAVAFKMAEMVGEKYAPRGEFIELAVDGEELGLYYLVRKTEIGKNAVDLREPEGILVELDNIHNGGEYCYRARFGDCLVVKDIVMEDREEEIMHDFLAKFDQVETAARAGDFETVRENLDVESLAQYYLVSEFAANPDAYNSSFYFYRNGSGDKIHVGPVWDFDLAFGNFRWIWREEDEIMDPRVLNNNIMRIKTRGTIARLVGMPEVQAEIWRVFQEKLAGRVEKLISYYDFLATRIRAAAVRDEKKWPGGYLMSYTEAVLKLRKWILERYEFLEGYYCVL